MTTDCIELTEHATHDESRPPTWPVVELSADAAFHMHDAYYRYATEDHFWIQWRFSVIQHLLECDGFELGDRVLEVGSGNGVVQSQFERAWDRVVEGCDLNRHALSQGPPTRGKRYLYNVLDRRAEWQQHFSSVLLLDTLEHIEASCEFLDAIRFHLTPRGLIVINVPALPALYSRYDAVQGHVQRYTAGQLRRELTAAGFEVLAHTYWGGNLVPIAWLRKFLVRFAAHDEVLSKGFAPPSALVDRVLRGLRAAEQTGWKLPWGTSLAAIARRLDSPEMPA